MSSKLLSNLSSYCLCASKGTALSLVRIARGLDPTNAAAEPRKRRFYMLEGSVQKPHEMTCSLWVPPS